MPNTITVSLDVSISIAATEHRYACNMGASQVVRVETEHWLAKNGYCLACDADTLQATTANTPARDFVCSRCRHPYELKATKSALGKRVVDGAYSSMMSRLADGSVPSFFLMRYAPDWTVIDLSAIHHSMLTPTMVEERRPLASTARRAGWIGCNLRLDQVPPKGRISIICNGFILPRNSVRMRFRAAEALATFPLETRTWAAALLLRLHRLRGDMFELRQVYLFEAEFHQLFPKNRHIREKIRQQLQVLRDAGLVRFNGRGSYTLLSKTDS